MSELNKTARTAGLLYLLIVCCGFFYLRYVPSKLMVPGHIAATISHISNSPNLFRSGILVEILSDIIFLLLALAFYQLFYLVNKTQAVFMLVFVVFGVVISLISLQNKLAVLTLINKPDYLNTFSPAYFKTQVLLNLDMYRNGILIGQIFWGLWLFPLGYLVFKSGLLPKIIGVVLMIGCVGYLANFTGSFFFTGYNQTAISNYMTLPASLGELSICLWLLIGGVNEKPAANSSQ
jgi:hypothetical protein